MDELCESRELRQKGMSLYEGPDHNPPRTPPSAPASDVFFIQLALPLDFSLPPFVFLIYLLLSPVPTDAKTPWASLLGNKLSAGECLQTKKHTPHGRMLVLMQSIGDKLTRN